MKHLFVPYALALALKEKGCKEDCFGFWLTSKDKPVELCFGLMSNSQTEKQTKDCAASLYQQVIDWLETKGVCITYNFYTVEGEKLWQAYIFKEENVFVSGYTFVKSFSDFSTKYEAISEAIKEAFKLIP